MSTFITYFTYTQAAMAAFTQSPEDRGLPLKGLIEGAMGGTMHGVYWEIGSNNGFVLYDVPQAEQAMVGTMVANAAGHLTNLRTVPLVTAQQLASVASQAAAIAYRAPG
jgi:uncharacterized protein with GYD domain